MRPVRGQLHGGGHGGGPAGAASEGRAAQALSGGEGLHKGAGPAHQDGLRGLFIFKEAPRQQWALCPLP